MLMLIPKLVFAQVSANTAIPDLIEDSIGASGDFFITHDISTDYSRKMTISNVLGVATDLDDGGIITAVNSAEWLTRVTDETGTGVWVFSISPALVTPALGTPTALVGTNITGTAAGLTAGLATAAAADGTDCGVGEYARGVDVSWNGELCTDATTEIDSAILTHTGIAAAHQALVTLNASATTGGMSLSGQEISNRAATNAQTGYATAAHITAIEANTLKDTNVSTNLSEGTSTETTVDVNSSDGTNATLVSASTTRAGLLTKAKFDEIVANNAKDTNVSTNLSEGTSTETTVDVNSSDGTNATLVSASATRAGLLTKAKFDEVVVNSLHSADNTQAHSDYLLNNASDTMTGLLTTTGGLITSASITINSDTSRLYLGVGSDASIYMDGTSIWFDDGTVQKKSSDIGSGSGGGAEVNDLETITTDILINEIPIGTGTNTVVYKTAPSCSNATTSKLLYNSTTQELSCGTDQTGGAGGGGFAWQLEPKGAKLPATNPMGIDAGNLQWRGLFDDTTDECARWQSILTPYGAGALDIDIVYSLETASTADTVRMDVYVMCGKSNADMDTDSFDTANSVTSGSVSTTAGYQAKLTGTLTNDDSCAEDDLIIIKICRDASASEDDDDVEFRGASVHE